MPRRLRIVAASSGSIWKVTLDGQCGPGSVVYETIVLAPTRAGLHLEGLDLVNTATCSSTAHCSCLANTHNDVIVLVGDVR